jgi:hypothetical protein
LQHDYEEFRAHGKLPNLYPHLDNTGKYDKLRSDLEDLQTDISNQEKNQIIQKLYTWRIDESILNIDMILAAGRQDDKAFETANRKIYGEPNRTIFDSSCAWIREQIRTAVAQNKSIEKVGNELLGLLPDTRGDASELFPDPETFSKVRNLHLEPSGYLPQLLGNVQLPAQVTPKEGDAITRQAIQNVGSDFTLTDSPSGLWAVLQSHKQVVRPQDYALNSESFQGIIAHEIGSHLLESTNGSKSKLKLFELGLGRYEAGNEGRAVMREQIMYSSMDEYVYQPQWYPTKASWEYRVAIHMIISLATGVMGRRWDFTELYNLITKLYEFWTVSRNLPIIEEVIHRGAWSIATRALKGTSGQGGAYYKDIVYLEGNIACWRAAKQNPELVLYGDLGKFDIANHEHVMMLNELGILPKFS